MRKIDNGETDIPSSTVKSVVVLFKPINAGFPVQLVYERDITIPIFRVVLVTEVNGLKWFSGPPYIDIEILYKEDVLWPLLLFG